MPSQNFLLKPQNGRKPHYTYKLDSRRRNIGQAVLHSLRNAVDSRTNHSEVEVMEKPMAQTAADIAQALLAEEGQAQSNAAGGGEAAANGYKRIGRDNYCMNMGFHDGSYNFHRRQD
jgi:hypothetical protein